MENGTENVQRTCIFHKILDSVNNVCKNDTTTKVLQLLSSELGWLDKLVYFRMKSRDF